MKTLWRYLLLAAMAPLLLNAGCSSAGGTAGGPADTSPPTIAGIIPIDMNHIEVMFEEDVNKSSAEEDDNDTIVESTPVPPPRANRRGRGSVSPGDTISTASTVPGTDKRTVLITTWDTMTNVS